MSERRPQPIGDEAVDAALRTLPGWQRAADQLRVRYELPAFPDAVAFTQRIAEIAEQLQHHPEWRVAYRRVEVSTTTHDAGALTALDLELAGRIVEAAAQSGASVVRLDDAGDRRRTWVPPGHFYSPIVDPDELAADADRLFAAGARELPSVDLRIPEQVALARQLAAFYGEEDFPEQPRAGRRYCLDQEYFPFGDAFAYYALLRHLRPRRVVEVGVGWSSAVLLDTDEAFLDSAIDITFIDPYPERLLERMTDRDRERTRLLPRRLQDVDLDEFRRLEAGDILFIDSSHVAKTGSDVLHALFVVLPALADGVWVHIHDIHANFEYPRTWVEEGRSWNENYLVRAFLMHNDVWQIALHAASLGLYAAAELLPLMPRIAENEGGSLWLRKSGGAVGGR